MGKPIFKWFIIALTAVVLVAVGAPTYYFVHKHGGVASDTAMAQKLEKVVTITSPKDSYDVIVAGTDPEGVMAAVSAARNGLKTLLVDGRNRGVLGGLMTLGWLNTIDLDQDKDKIYVSLPGVKPPVLNKGLFSEWFDMIEGTSFDVNSAANAFNKLVKKESNIDVVLKTNMMEPIIKKSGDSSVVEGLSITLENGTKTSVKAGVVIDATQDADIAAAAGVGFTVGREDLGDPKARMAVTTVFRLKNVTTDVWQKVMKRMAEDGDENTGADEHSAWGYGEMQKYPPQNKDQLKMRGLNIGRQNDNTILINALQIFGIDSFDPKSRDNAMEMARKELPFVLDHMKKLYPEFAGLELVDIAPELYVRETRHMIGMYRLSMVDVLDNRDQWDRIAFGSYKVDLQRISPTDNGAEIVAPYKYAIPFRSIVPQKVDGLLVVGRAASYDSQPHGSGRVIPNGMAEGQAAGVAAKLAKDNKLTFRQLTGDKTLIAKMQDMLNNQGMELKPYKADPNVKYASGVSLAYMAHKDYPGLKYAVTLNLTSAKGNNDFALDESSNPKRLANHMLTIRKKYAEALPGDPNAALTGMDAPDKQQLTLAQASLTIAKSLNLAVTVDKAQQELENRGLLTIAAVNLITDKQKLTNGDVYMLIKDLMEAKAGLKLQ